MNLGLCWIVKYLEQCDTILGIQILTPHLTTPYESSVTFLTSPFKTFTNNTPFLIIKMSLPNLLSQRRPCLNKGNNTTIFWNQKPDKSVG